MAQGTDLNSAGDDKASTKELAKRSRSRRGPAAETPLEKRLFELAHFRTHAVRLEHFLRKEINASQIYRRLLSVLNVGHINLDDPPSKYIKSAAGDGSKALRAFAVRLNHSSEFDQDGLDLTPGDFAAVKTMRDLGGAIVAWYQRNGWTVLPE
jgi:hypothetical protein